MLLSDVSSMYIDRSNVEFIGLMYLSHVLGLCSGPMYSTVYHSDIYGVGH